MFSLLLPSLLFQARCRQLSGLGSNTQSHVPGPCPDQVMESLETVMASLGKRSAYFTLTNAVGTSVHQFQLL